MVASSVKRIALCLDQHAMLSQVYQGPVRSNTAEMRIFTTAAACSGKIGAGVLGRDTATPWEPSWILGPLCQQPVAHRAHRQNLGFVRHQNCCQR